MDLTLETLKAERGILFLVDDAGTARPEVVRGGVDDTVVARAAKVSSGIVRHSVLKGEAVLSDDARVDERFATPSVMLYNIVSFMCVPIVRRGRILGTLYVDHREMADLFAKEDLAFLSALADLCAVALENSSLHRKLEGEIRSLRSHLESRYRFDNLVGSSQEMENLFRLMERIADSGASVLIQGENGTGKELVARALHYNSVRRSSPFVTVDCGSMPPELAASELFGHRRGSFTGATEDRPGLFEQAQGGTVFLDQVEDLPLKLQPHLLRVLQEGEVRRVGETEYRKVSWRLVAATRFDLDERVRAGLFREDLYYRLRVIPLVVPPLRKRGSDIELLARHFLDAAAPAAGRKPSAFSRDALERLRSHSWPGNVRELKHAVERAVLLAEGESIQVADLGLDVRAASAVVGSPIRRVMARAEIEQTLRDQGGNVSAAADALGLTRRGLQKMMRRFEMRREDFEKAESP
jgi:Nif-specific regulatory protein